MYYCFCDQYDLVELSYGCGQQYGVLCRMQIEFGNFEEMLDHQHLDEKIQKDSLKKLLPYLTGKFPWWFRKEYLEEQIQFPFCPDLWLF